MHEHQRWEQGRGLEHVHDSTTASKYISESTSTNSIRALNPLLLELFPDLVTEPMPYGAPGHTSLAVSSMACF